MRKLNELASIAVPIVHCQHDAVITEKAVVFTISWEGNRFKAMPLLSKEELATMQLPAKSEFVYFHFVL
jgi:hypothetical protein